MGFVGLVGFSLQCFDVLAWPLLALVYPLCCSIRAIEANSVSDTQKLNTYWVVFSLILLFEHTFTKLLEWIPLWPYIRLMIVFSLVIPHFNGAFYVYKHLICPCLSVDFQIVINWFNKPKKSSLKREDFLAEVERYVKENGPEALEKIVASKSERTKSNPDVKELKTVSSVENKESKSRKPDVAQKDIKAVQVSQAEPSLTGTENRRFPGMDIQEKATGVAAADGGSLKATSSKKVQELTLKVKNQAESKLTQMENGTFAAVETKEKAVEVATWREVVESSQKVQKEWTCAVCQLTTESEATLNSHFQGKKHKAACEALKAKYQAFLPKFAPAATAKECHHQPNEKPGESTTGSVSEVSDTSKEEAAEGASSNGAKTSVVTNLEENVKSTQQNPIEVPSMKNLTLSCNICNVHCPSEAVMSNHLNGKKHQKRMQQRQQNPIEVPSMTNLTLSCNICNVHCPSEIVMSNHLNGKKHQEKMQQWQQNPN